MSAKILIVQLAAVGWLVGAAVQITGRGGLVERASVAISETASPGPLDPQGHAAIHECSTCHASSFAATGDDMTRRCTACHQSIAAEPRRVAEAGTGCASCHGEHAGARPYRRTMDGPYHRPS